jgi:hypothetical protein
MDTTARPIAQDAGSDPYFQATEVGPAKEPSSPGQGGRAYRRRMAVLGVFLAVVWLGVLVDPQVGPMVLFALGGFGAVLGVFVAAMGLGLLGFGLCAAGDRLVGWLRRGSRWPEESEAAPSADSHPA